MTQTIILTAHNDESFEGSYRVHLEACGRAIALGRNPIRLAAVRLLEEGMAHGSTMLDLRYVDPKLSPVRCTVSEAMKAA